jgi:tetratricopeptide (TPR) repeat protein
MTCAHERVRGAETPTVLRAAAVLVVVLLVLAAGGCGGRDGMTARYRAERLAWQAMKLHQAMLANPKLATEEMRATLAGKYRTIVRAFPPPVDAKTLSDVDRDIASITAQSRSRLAQLALETSDFDSATRLYTSVRDSYRFDRSVSVGAAVALAGVRRSAGDWPGAVLAYRDLMKRWRPAEKKAAPPDLGVLRAPIEIASGYRELGDSTSSRDWYERARAYEKRWVSKWPGTPTAEAAMSLWAETFVAEGRWGEAAAAYEELDGAFGRPANRAQIWLTLADLYDRRLGRPDQALDYYTRVADNYGGSVPGATAEVALARREMAEGRAAEARARLSAVLAKFHDEEAVAATALYYLALAYEREGKWEDAAREFDTLAREHPTTMYGLSSRLYVAEHYSAMGEKAAATSAFERAVEHYERVIRDYDGTPAELAARNYLVEARLKEEKWAEAAQTLEETAAKFPDSDAAPAMLLEAAELRWTRLIDREAAVRDLETVKRLVQGSAWEAEADRRLAALRG